MYQRLTKQLDLVNAERVEVVLAASVCPLNNRVLAQVTGFVKIFFKKNPKNNFHQTFLLPFQKLLGLAKFAQAVGPFAVELRGEVAQVSVGPQLAMVERMGHHVGI